jgi:hypothetical protein
VCGVLCVCCMLYVVCVLGLGEGLLCCVGGVLYLCVVCVVCGVYTVCIRG